MTSTDKPADRLAFSAIVDRPPLVLPQGLRLVIWPIVNLEVWEIERAMARQVLPAPTGVAVLPDVPNWSWHEYGMRVGVWRLFAALDRVQARATLSINAGVVDRYPRVAEAARERRWEFMGHSYVQMPIHQVADQRQMIERSLDRLQAFTGARPRGWLGPGLTETLETPELLAAAGVEYIGDWVHDDEPTVITTRNGPLVTLPYTVELNDIAIAMVQHHASDLLLRRASDQFDRLYAEGAERAKILSIAIHPYITGVPHRIKYLEAFLDYARGHQGVAFWTGDEILDWYKSASLTS